MSSEKKIDPIYLTEVARRYLGTPYSRTGGNVKGVNCIGFWSLCMREANFPEQVVERAHKYAMRPTDMGGNFLLKGMTENLERIPVAKIARGDVVLFRVDGAIQHLGVVSRDEPLCMIHASAKHEKVVEERLQRGRNWPVAAFRFPAG